jgi:PAS domain S-box-containing protein
VVKASQALSSEIVLDKLIENLMRIAIEHAGADRGVLIIPTGDEQRIEAEATTCRDGIEVRLRGKAVIASEFPVSILQYVARTVESVILDDASVHNPFLADEYMRQRRCRSVLCLPLIKQSKIIGALYLENSYASHVFTPAKAALLKLLASQAAISIENAQLYANLQKAELSVRQAESELRLLIDAIPGAAWSALPDGSNDFVNRGWVEYTNLPLEDTKGSGWSAVVHPDELDSYWDHWRIAVASGEPFDAEVRFRRADGQYRWFLVRSLPLRDELGNIIKWYGTCTDIEDRKRAEALQAELARMSRLTTMGELTASIAHEIIQPLSAIVTNGNTCLHWLEDRNIDLAKARSSATHAVRDAERAGDIIRRIRALMTKSETHKVEIDLNHVIGEVLALTHNELLKRQISVHTELALPLPPVLGDRVQLQQLMLNLIMNCVEAMATVVSRPKELSVETQVHSTGCVLTLVRDTGVGLDWDNSAKLFDAFFTTKPEGTGMGLAICRSIVQAHGGHIWASQRVPDGAVFQFTLPCRGYDEEPAVVERMEVEPQDS